MAVVTFMSDYGWKDHYVAAVKASVLAINPSLQIIDISHDIRAFDIGHGAYVLKSVFRDFPKNSVHLVSIDPVGREKPGYVAIKLEDHYFVGNDSGLFSMLSDQQNTAQVRLNNLNPKASTFPGKDILGPVAANLASGKNIHELGEPISGIQRVISRQLKATKREIVGHVIRVDKYGNLITNIPQREFEAIQKINGQVPFEIQVGREVFTDFNSDYHEVESGNCYLLFNSLGLLQIGINKGNAAELLGLKLDTPISIHFSI